jgi:hypothetical protein
MYIYKLGNNGKNFRFLCRKKQYWQSGKLKKIVMPAKIGVLIKQRLVAGSYVDVPNNN